MATAILAIGALVVGLGVGAAYGIEHWVAEAPSASADAPAMTSDGLLVDARLSLDAGAASIDRDLTLDPDAARSLPAPGLSFHRSMDGLGIDAPVDASLDLDVASGSHNAKDPAAASSSSTQSGAIHVLRTAPEVATLAAAAFASAGLLVYFWASVKAWTYKLAVAPVMGLYAHITRAEVFDNGVRERIFEAIRTEPGVSASELGRKTGVSWGTTMYHLDVLEQTRMVTSVRDGRYRRYFANGADVSKQEVSILRNPVTQRVVTELRGEPGATQKDLAARAMLTPQALHWHLVRLVAAGLVEKRRDGRLVRHYAK